MCIGRGKRDGHTLIELMVASLLLILLLGLIYEMFVAAKRYQDNCQAKIALQGNVLKCLAALNRDLGESDPNAINCASAANAISFANPRGLHDGLVSFDSAGRLYWKKNVCYWVENSAEGIPTLWRRGISLATGDPLLPYPVEVPGPLLCSTVISDTTRPRRQIADHITTLNTALSNDGTVTTNVTGEMKLLIHTYSVQIQGSTLIKN